MLAIRAQTQKQRSASFVHEALAEIRHYLHDLDITPEGPPTTILNPTGEPDTIDIEVAWPIHHPVSGAGRIYCGTLPITLTSPSQHKPPDQDDPEPSSLL